MAIINDTPPSQLIPFPNVSVLDFFLPGSTRIMADTEKLFSGKLNGFASLLCLFGVLIYTAKLVTSYAHEWIDKHLASTVYVPYSDEAFDMFTCWVEKQPFAQRARSFIARVHRGRVVTRDDRMQEKLLKYSPWSGTFFFLYKRRLLWLSSSQKEVGYCMEEIILVRCFGRSPKILKELLSDCRNEYVKLNQNKTLIFGHRNGGWKKMKSREIRPISTVIMNQEEKADLLNDIKTFISDRGRYSTCGIPYRRGYLLHGPPGTGKSSLSLSIAGYFNWEVYIINISSINGNDLSDLLNDLPSRCVLLLEDVDAVDMTESREPATEKSCQAEVNNARKSRGNLSLSELLNAIDGVASPEGRVLFMTTNHIEHLDAALIRPGRADKKIELTFADNDIATQLFRMVFKSLQTDIATEEEKTEYNKSVERLACEFAGKLPEGEFSPAEIQSFLLEHRSSPQKAAKNVKAWIARTKRAKRVDEASTKIIDGPVSSAEALSRAPTLSTQDSGRTSDPISPPSASS